MREEKWIIIFYCQYVTVTEMLLCEAVGNVSGLSEEVSSI
jgi:hypothetical protein